MLLLSLLAPNFVWAYPPDNAAVIYYRSIVDFEKPDDALWGQVRQAAKGQTEINKQVRDYLESEATLIQSLETASAIPNCDWGLDFSHGLSMELPHISTMRCFAQIVSAKARLKIQQEQYPQALDLCLVNIRMAGHVGNDTLISYLVGTAMTKSTYDAIGQILSAMPPDEAFLTDIQRELELPEHNLLNMKTALQNESWIIADEIVRMGPETKSLFSDQSASEKMQKDMTLLTDGDPAFLKASADYYRGVFDKYIIALGQPYEQALKTLKESMNAPSKDYKAGKKEALATTFLAPAVTMAYDIDIRRKTHQNALIAAVQLYRDYAKKGTLPEKLPAMCPKDLFSGQSFEYEKTDKGFTLRCKQADTKDKIHEYTFKLSK